MRLPVCCHANCGDFCHPISKELCLVAHLVVLYVTAQRRLWLPCGSSFWFGSGNRKTVGRMGKEGGTAFNPLTQLAQAQTGADAFRCVSLALKVSLARGLSFLFFRELTPSLLFLFSIHVIERRALPEFFNGKNKSKTPEM